MDDQTKNPSGGGAGKRKLAPAHYPKDRAQSQRVRLLARLKRGPVTTLDARSKLFIMSPASRVFELRNLGYSIETKWLELVGRFGIKHRIAEYHLRHGGQRHGN